MAYHKINLPAAWDKATLNSHPDWIYTLSSTEVTELEMAANRYADTHYPANRAEQVKLPTLTPLIKNKFLIQLESGIGCLLVRGIKASKYNQSEINRLLLALGLQFGTPMSQSIAGERIHEVYSEGLAPDDPKTRGTNTDFELGFHNDPCDVAALMCVRRAMQGGASRLVSSAAIHNEMLVNHPKLLEQLYQPYYALAHRVNTTALQPHYLRPIFAIEQGYFTCNILRRYIELANAEPTLPNMTPLQIEALDVFEALASSNKLCLEHYLEPGDILFINNYLTLHARTAFKDADDSAQKRLLLRLWLSVSNSRPLPESYRSVYRNIKAGELRGGFLPSEDK